MVDVKKKQRDVSIDQNTMFINNFLKCLAQRGDGQSVNIFTVGQLIVDNRQASNANMQLPYDGSTGLSEKDKPKIEDIKAIDFDLTSDEILYMLIDSFEKPRLQNMLRAVIKMCDAKFGSRRKAADWLGVLAQDFSSFACAVDLRKVRKSTAFKKSDDELGIDL